jgi:segregation and condensation protein B
MSEPSHDPATSSPPAIGKQPAPRFSLERLSSAFARLMGATPAAGRAATTKPQVTVASDDDIESDDALPVTAQMIVEGMLFVGSADARAFTSREIASHIRDVDAAEVDAIVAQLNERYHDDETAYEITGDAAGYRLQLRPELGRMRDRVRGRTRVAKLTPAAIEVLSVVAYRQGVTGDELNRLRGSQSHAILAQLVRRQLVRVERPATAPRSARYHTTDRFNQLFGVKSPADLPRSEDLDDS